MNTPEQRKERFRELQSKLQPMQVERAEIHVELMKLTVEIAMDELKAAFPEAQIVEAIYPRIENRTPEDSTGHIISMLKGQNVTPKIIAIDRTRTTISFVL